jgi:glycosyltransferase involved in cell wall biosynthesis
MFRRLIKGFRPPRRARENLWVWSPLVVPLQRFALVRAFNRWALNSAISIGLRRLCLRREMLWTYNPLTTDFLDLKRFEVSVYHCVDDIKAQPGMPAAVLERGDRDLTEKVDVVFTTAPRLQEVHRRWNDNTYLLPNVADYHHFHQALDEDTQVPADLQAMPVPRIGFIGALSGYKVDFELLRHVAQNRPQWSIVLIGEIGEGDPWTNASLLRGLPNLHCLGPRPYEDLPRYLKDLDVALLPNRQNEYTASMFPMKFFEYLAAGKPVVSVDLPALRDYASVACLASSREEFIQGVEAALAGKVAPLEQWLAIAREHTYESRMDTMLNIVQESTD